MGAIERFIVENIDTVIVLAFILLPIILNAKKLKKKVQEKAGKPVVRQKQTGASLESKVRRFFDELVEQQQPKKPALELEPIEPEPASLEVPAPEELFVEMPPPPVVEKLDSTPSEEEEVIRKISARELKRLDQGIEGLALSRSSSLKPKGSVRIGFLKDYSRTELRKAIVMVEVLGKPVALKR